MEFISFAIIFVIFVIRLQLGLGATFDECDGADDESFVASWQDCSAYIYCDGDDSLMGYCEDDEYYDPDAYACDSRENVYCPLNEEPEEPEGPEEPIITTTTTTITTPIATTTAADSIQTTTTTTFEPLTIPPLIKDNCPITDDPNQIVLIANSQSCTDYYLCYHGHAIEMQCTNHLHFNTYTGKCDFPENVQCLNDRPDANKCLPHVTDFFPHPEKCNYFYYCIKGFMTIQQCPFYYGWDVERRSCVQMSQAKCYNNEKKLNF